ncbi:MULTISPECIES: 2Fe-2S iron-sulfur cluster-binding protein [Kordiimonas]|uniref:2Fe-2S iron-sulfur cluster-binding protein n=1 Tax=Kordiimonas TaxID=288021 RepID=UPI001FF39D2A|nr:MULTISPECIES: 2Fe-2S iron-sulfur cluster-binding protein [Kordiimonas]MCK0067820.1 (2Fe-2S)-binding protein [Kordiimonas laminariae]UTW60219.1 (2Fe-2S)-binding protein [Kordiimonas sp. SCSIO 12603]
MAKITFVSNDGEEQVIEAAEGESVMETALNNGIDWIMADCGGACACATCHVYVDEDQLEATGEPSEMENSMLEFNDHQQSNSRLSCQIKVTEDLDGLRVTAPESQY